MKVAAIIPAAGAGKRMNANVNKQYLTLAGKPILAHTLQKFEDCNLIDEIFLITNVEGLEYCRKEIIDKFRFKKVKKIIPGGIERQDSVFNGLKAVSPATDLIMIHDGVRPFVPNTILAKSINETIKHQATTVAIPSKDTLKEVGTNKVVIKTLDRKKIWMIQTPQTFKYKIILKAYEQAYKDGFYGTDDSILVERIGHKIKIIMGDYKNIKITTIEDLAIGEIILKMQSLKKRQEVRNKK